MSAGNEAFYPIINPDHKRGMSPHLQVSGVRLRVGSRVSVATGFGLGSLLVPDGVSLEGFSASRSWGTAPSTAAPLHEAQVVVRTLTEEWDKM